MAELNFGLLTPPGSQSVGNAFVSGMDQAAAARAQENQNALSQYTLAKAKREDELTNQLLGDLRVATTPEEIYRAYQRAGKGKEASELQSAALTRQKLAGEIAAQPGARAKTSAETAKLAEDAKYKIMAEVAGFPDAESANAAIDYRLSNNLINRETADRLRQGLTPENFPKWKHDTLIRLTTPADQLKQSAVTTRDTDRGGYIERQTYNAQGLPVGAPVSLSKTPTPGSVPGITQANIAVARAQDEGIQVGGAPVNAMPGAQPTTVPPVVNNMPGVPQAVVPAANNMLGAQPTTAPIASGLSAAATRRVAEETAKAQIPKYNAVAGGFVTPPTTNNPKGTFVPLTAVQDAKDVDANRKALKISGYDPTTGKDEIADLINKSTGGVLQAGAAGTLGAFNYTTTGADAIARLGTRVKAMTLSLLNGKLGAGISNADRDFIEGQFGDIANPNLASGKRLAAWDEAKKRMLSLGMLGGAEPPTAPPAGAGKPSLDSIFGKKNP